MSNFKTMKSFMILIYIKNQSDGAELYAMIEHW